MSEIGVDLRRKVFQAERDILKQVEPDVTAKELAFEADAEIMEAVAELYSPAKQPRERIAACRRALLRAHGRLMLLEDRVGGDQSA